jgi:hypothetical protein
MHTNKKEKEIKMQGTKEAYNKVCNKKVCPGSLPTKELTT